MTTAAMLKFVSRKKRMPDKRRAEARLGDFDEIYAEFAKSEAKLQAGRCSQCGVPFCQTHCPLQNNIPDWLMLTAENRMEEAYGVAAATNTFPEICGRICPQDRLCEGNCVIEKGFDSVTIGAVERHITETAFANGWVKPPKPREELPQSVGIIGAGPAGLAAADMLRRYGYQVVVYDRYDRVGGLMMYGIPSFKLEKHVVARREKLLREGGVKFVLNTDIAIAPPKATASKNKSKNKNKVMPFAELRDKHDAILIATGVYQARGLDKAMLADQPEAMPIQALDYLTHSNRLGLGDKLEGGKNLDAPLNAPFNAKGKHVVVIGGGDTAMDCVRTAVRQEAKSVV
ncbi:MAG: FAD-dependent oxidoreductase, partial [Proteobacteria bacterium]|nr:FAD-dependent oxidoreductase [Pseudomonadota bacterium]